MKSKYIVLGLVSLTASIALYGCDKIPGTTIYKAHKLIASMMFDPDAVRFKNEVSNSSVGSVCGEVNGKNRMGAYVGFTRYIYSDPGVAEVSDGPPDFESYIRDTDPYNEYTFKEVYTKLANACRFVDAWKSQCPESRRHELESYEANCKIWRKDTAGSPNLKKAVRGY
jgi:hypothetical protein